MDIFTIISLVAILGALIVGWRPVTNIIGPTKFSLNVGVLVLVWYIFHLVLKIMMSIALGYILFIINIIKFIINRAKAKKAEDTVNTITKENG